MSNYTKIPLSQVNPSVELPTDIYLFVNEKYLKIKYSGETIGAEKYDYYLSKNVSSIYVASSEERVFQTWIENNKSKSIGDMIEEAGEENKNLVESSLKMEEKVFEVFSDQELTPDRVATIQDHVQEVVTTMKKSSTAEKALVAMLDRVEHIAAHSVNVANMAVYLAMAAGHSNSFVLENVYLAGILHDYGKTKFPPDVLLDKTHPKYKEHMEQHPEDSCQIIKDSEGIPDQVFEMIIQHHERFDGQGYPHNISGDDFGDLSQILSMANELDKYLVDNKSLGKMLCFSRALELLKSGEDSRWSPKFYPRISKAFEMAFVSNKSLYKKEDS